MKPVLRPFLLALAVGWFAVPVAARDDEDINPDGKWPKYAVKQPKRFHVWRNDSGWHVRTTTQPNQRTVFAGTVRVFGGSFDKIGGFDNLEKGRGKNAKDGDYGKWNAEKTELDFRFVTNGGEDSFDFTVTDGATAVEFSLKVDDLLQARHVFIGKGGKHPKSATFKFPARSSK